jgi:glycosyltransferase involved in cell wall biosynthesis
MKIAIDARVIEKEMTGISRYLLDILNNLKNIDNKNEYVLFSTIPLSNFDKDYFQNIVLNKYKIDNKLYSPFWLNFVLKKYLIKNKFDLFFSPNNLCPIGASVNFRNVITVHDIMFIMDKSYYSFLYRNYLHFLLKHAINKSDKIITISSCSKRDIIRHYKVSDQKVEVIYRAADPKFKERKIDEADREQLRKRYPLPNNYILYVGLIGNRKNIYTILTVSDILKTKNVDIKFVLIGKAHYGFRNIKKAIEERRDRIVYLDDVTDEHLPYIYNEAKVFLFTSYYEGFGLPVLEAMQSGIPVVVSNTSSLPEVVGNFGIMSDPNDAEGFANGILKLLQDQKLYFEYCEKSLIGSRKFNQFDIAKEHVKLFNNI